MISGHVCRMMWIAVVLVSLTAPLTSALDCPGWFDLPWSKYCCENKALGCFTTDAPYDHLPRPCCYNDVDDVTYSLYTRSHQKSAETLHLSKSIPSQFDGGTRTVFASHGWVSDSENDEFQKMKDAFLQREDMNVILIDWPSWRVNYDLSASETRTVGKLTALMMEKLVTEAGARYDDLWCVGHSLGAHVCGHAGKYTPQKIRRITGLDPAGPSFEVELAVFFPDDLRLGLASSDAQFVDVIHTDTDGTLVSLGIALGTVRHLGHMDFYVNGREEQPGCLGRKKRSVIDDLIRKIGEKARHTDMSPACSHMRAVDYFNEAVRSDCYVARLKCDDEYNMPESCSPCNGACAIMGYNAPGSGENGMYLVETAPKGSYPPHCVG